MTPRLVEILLVICVVLGSRGVSADPVPARVIPVGPERELHTPSEAARVVRDGDVIEIDAGLYPGDVAVWRQNRLTLRAVGGRAHLRADGANARGKAIWVINGDDVVVDGIEFSGARVPDRNGAGIRAEGRNLTVRNSYFHDNENGLLAGKKPGSNVVVEYSEFARNGHGDGYSHNIYIGKVSSFTLRYSYVHHARVGHNVKSRAERNFILSNRLTDERTGTSSYIVDLPNGGLSYIVGNLIQQGPRRENRAIVSFGAEGALHSRSALYVVNNTFVNDGRPGVFIVNSTPAPAALLNNIFAGKGRMVRGAARSAHNLAAEDPLFVDRDGYDYRLRTGSPAIDAGGDPGMSGAFPLAPRTQYRHPADAEPRPVRGPIDIGAYEYSE